MTTAISDYDDLLRILDEYPERLQALRRRVAGEDLLALPDRFNSFVEEQREINAELRQFNAEQRRFNAELRQFNAEQRQINAEQRRFNEQQRQTNQEVRQDLARLRGAHARNETIRRSLLVALRMGLRRERILTDDDLLAMMQAAGASDISSNDIESFINADLVMETTDGDGQTVYVAMEISFTANRRDTRRAMRNAGFLTRLTGQPARPAVASVRNDPEISDLIASQQVYWHAIREDDFEPE